MTRSSNDRRPRPLVATIAIGLLAAALLPGPTIASVAARDPVPFPTGPASISVAPPSDTGGTVADEVGHSQPSVMYEQAMAHAGDRITFTAAGRVSVPFAPRSTDHWPVGGGAPVRLPVGRASGAEIARSPQGSHWAPLGSGIAPSAGAVQGTGTSAPIDTAGNRGAVLAAPAAWTVPSTASAEPAVASGLRRQVFGFLPYWQLTGAAASLRYDDLSTIAYFSVGADSAGNLLKKNGDGTTTTGWSGWTSSSLTSVINAAHSRGTRVVLTLSVFAWTTGEASKQTALLGSSAARLNFAQQAAAAVRDRGADGINLDFEPLSGGYENQFVALLQTVRSELNKVAAGYQLTYDTTGWIGNYPLEASVAPGAADAIFVMGYDYRTSSSSPVGSIDPLSGPAYDLTDTVRSYTSRVSPSKVILGLPWYGRAWSTPTDTAHAANQSGLQYGYSAAVNYGSIVDLVAQYGRRWDSQEQSPWFAYQRQNCTTTYGCVTSWRQVYYDDAQSMGLRYDLVNTYGLRGAGIWALGYDDGHPELYQAIENAFLTDTTGPATGIATLATSQPDEGFTVSWVGSDASGIASYDVQVSIDGGPWADWLTATAATSDVWLGQDGHGYAFRTRGRDTRGNVSPWTVTSTWGPSPTLAVGGFGSVSTSGLSYRTGPSTSAVAFGTLTAGTIVAVTGGPVTADGYLWWQVTQPIREWAPVSFAETDVWVASGPVASPTDYVGAYRAPNSTKVAAGILGFGFNGLGAASIGAGNAARRVVSPNGDGQGDTITLDWQGAVALDSLALRILRTDGTLLETRGLPAFAKGAHHYAWDGKVNGQPAPDGTYLLQLVGTAGSTTYSAPSAAPATAAQVAAFGVTVDHLPMTRLAGADRYATAAATSAASYARGVPVVYIATGGNFPDALVGAAAAGRDGAPLLLVSGTGIPAPIAAELARLAPARIVILGSTGVVSAATATAVHTAASR